MRKIVIRNHSSIKQSAVVSYIGYMLLTGQKEEHYEKLHIKQVIDTEKEAVFKVWEER